MTRCCAGPFGAVNPLEAPSWLIADPAMTANTEWLLRRASLSRSRTSTAAPSPQPVPSALAENALQRPSAASPRCRAKSMNIIGVVITVTPPARARADSPLRRDWHAKCVATSDDEQAVSTLMAGPCKPSAYATRPETTLGDKPVRAYPSTPSETPAP